MRETSGLHKYKSSSNLLERRTYRLLFWTKVPCFCTLLLNYQAKHLQECLQECLILTYSLRTLETWIRISRSCWQDEQPWLTNGYDCRPHPQGAGRATEQSK